MLGGSGNNAASVVRAGSQLTLLWQRKLVPEHVGMLVESAKRVFENSSAEKYVFGSSIVEYPKAKHLEIVLTSSKWLLVLI